MSNTTQPVLILYSHGRNPPLHPPPDLKYDLRSIPNPPKPLRDVSDGRSKRLREHLLAKPKFVARLKSVEEDIVAAMQSKLAKREIQLKENAKPSNDDAKDPQLKEEEEVEEDADESCDEPTLEDALSNDVVLRVGCNCALGHHRSVVFVCELAS
ncbi:hypothetical protein BDV96DRAFT_249533 [Lophiotrema nucula]|uniref:Uncharacterized protein n=1 Tax=Lophiotrema nucula TaxID=690887 RepID=A0A6A5YSC6_9PLEO|nr:hypothetical protein BDV96DRAFT_249533 [Lophiotrema nucula]